ncbi:microsomal triglyceride transfer protein large subunit-like [Liolophura sinensis]|uniref:microsomal triglyceride transfer protein large subunit-like n=1 Tax=Liolophura sinensis TaxID=3198878 RepID=UPI0031594849
MPSTMDLLCIVLPTLLSLTLVSHCCGLKYELGKSYRYGYETAIVFNQYSNQQTKSKDAGFYISTEIDLELIFQNADVQLYKLKVTSAKVTSVLRPELERKLQSLLKYPILFELTESFVEKVYTAEQDSVFATNFKKGIVSLFQVDTNAGSRPEVDVSGECTASYVVAGNTVTKSLIDCGNLELSGQLRRSNQLLGVTVKPETSYVYDISDGLINTAIGRNKISAQVNMRPGLNSAVIQRQEMKLRQAVSSGSLKASSVEEAVEKLASELGYSFGMDMLPSIQEVQQCSENCFSPASLVSKNKDMLTTQKMATKESAKAFLDLVRSFRNVGKNTVEEVFTGGDSYYIVSQLIDVGVAAQTESSQQALMDLLNFEDDYNIEYPERYLLAAAFTSHPSENIINNLLSLMKKKVPSIELRQSVVLSLGAVIHTFCSEEKNLQSPVIGAYQKTVIEQLAACTGEEEEGCQLMYLRSLGNAGLLDTLPILTKYAENGITPAVSIAALQALRRIPYDKISTQVKPVVSQIFHESYRQYDISVRSTALEVLLKLRPTPQEVENMISLCTPPVADEEFSTYILEKLQDKAKSDTFIRHTLIEALRNVRLHNYNTFAQKGLSSAVSGYLAVTPALNATFGLYMANSKSGLMKQSSMQVNAEGKDFSYPLLNFGLYADGIEALLGDDEGSAEEEGVEATAGMSLTIMDVLLRPIEFFRGSSGLMSAVWNAPSEPVSALQANFLLQDHSERLHLSNGLVVDLQVLGAASVDLSGSISISLWSRNSHSEVINSGALVIEGSMKLESEELTGGMTFSAEGGSSVHFTTDVDFYEMPLKMCLQMSRPSLLFSEKYRKFEKHKTLRKTLSVRREKSVPVNEGSFVLHKYNSRQCRVLIVDE